MMPDLYEDALSVIVCPDAEEKAQRALKTARQWQDGTGIRPAKNRRMDWPDRPGRPERPRLLPPRDMPKRRAGGKAGRINLLHALAHIELNAIDLAFDLIGRFAHLRMPEAFLTDWARVGGEEAKHFLLLQKRLQSLGSFYGALPAHDGLWEAARDTSHDLAARLAVVPLVLEARGLDVTPRMVEKLEKNGDRESAAILGVIYEDEKKHVAVGSKWFTFVCEREAKDPQSYYRQLVRTYFKGEIKPPFNKPAREQAGLPEEFYVFES